MVSAFEEPVTQVCPVDQERIAEARRRRQAIAELHRAEHQRQREAEKRRTTEARLALEQEQRRRRWLRCSLGAVVLLLGLGACVLAAVG